MNAHDPNRSTREFSSFIGREFIDAVVSERGKKILNIDLEDFPNTRPLEPIVINNHSNISATAKTEIVRSYRENGGAYLIFMDAPSCPELNPIFICVEQLKDVLNLQFPMRHPLEGHPEAIKRFGPDDGTFKVYDFPKLDNGKTYREVAETSDPFEVHQDGLGSGGNVETVFLNAESIPLFGGFTFLYDIILIGMAIRNHSIAAFESLFHADAITAVRPRGKGAIKVVSPILYLDQFRKPHSFFRKSSGEYRMVFKDNPDLAQAVSILSRLTQPFSQASRFTSFTSGGMLITNNRGHAHGRTGFLDGVHPNSRRLLSRKWFMTAAEHVEYKHIPGTFVAPEYNELRCEQFSESMLWGEWHYDMNADKNFLLCKT